MNASSLPTQPSKRRSQLPQWFNGCLIVLVCLVLIPVCGYLFPVAIPTQSRLAVIQGGDLTSNVAFTKETMPWRIYPGIPKTDDVHYYQLIRGIGRPLDEQEVGHITVVHYIDDTLANQAYNAIQREAELDKDPRPLDFGERGSQSGPAPYWNASDIVFQKCNTVAHIIFQGDHLSMLDAYAKILYDRIAALYC